MSDALQKVHLLIVWPSFRLVIFVTSVKLPSKPTAKQIRKITLSLTQHRPFSSITLAAVGFHQTKQSFKNVALSLSSSGPTQSPFTNVFTPSNVNCHEIANHLIGNTPRSSKGPIDSFIYQPCPTPITWSDGAIDSPNSLSNVERCETHPSLFLNRGRFPERQSRKGTIVRG